jgi:hypothetical protein
MLTKISMSIKILSISAAVLLFIIMSADTSRFENHPVSAKNKKKKGIGSKIVTHATESAAKTNE